MTHKYKNILKKRLPEFGCVITNFLMQILNCITSRYILPISSLSNSFSVILLGSAGV